MASSTSVAAAAIAAARSITFGLIKPELFVAPHRVAAAHEAIARAGFQVLARRATVVAVPMAEAFYAEHRGKFFHPRLIASITSGPLEALILGRADDRAIAHWRELIGPTHALRARTGAPTSLRAAFGLSDTRNGFHGADSPASVVREGSLFFADDAAAMALLQVSR
eukprot:Amastigsp_a2572_46.p1 type:complete len:167 gc:universal Amastigsp_a2572_46:45-545(+)